MWPPYAPPCEYGAACYRRNPKHIGEFSHPVSHLLQGLESWEGLGTWKRVVSAGGIDCSACANMQALRARVRFAFRGM